MAELRRGDCWPRLRRPRDEGKPASFEGLSSGRRRCRQARRLTSSSRRRPIRWLVRSDGYRRKGSLLMARMRYVKPEYWTDSKIIKLGPWARLLYIGSWNFAICEVGHLDDDAMALKLKVLPADPIDADEVLEEIVAAGRIVRKTLPDGRTYLVIPRLPNHQKTETRWGT